MDSRRHNSNFSDGKTASLYTREGIRKYLNHSERERALAAMASLEPAEMLFTVTLAWTGARVSEVLALTPAALQIEAGLITLPTLKRRAPAMRELPVPPWLVTALERHFRISETQRNPATAERRLWPWHRVTAWRIIKRVMTRAGITGPRACPRGLRHAFGVGTLQAGVPLTLTQKWMGHARLSTTAIYGDVAGPEEIAFAVLFWRGPQSARPTLSDANFFESHDNQITQSA